MKVGVMEMARGQKCLVLSLMVSLVKAELSALELPGEGGYRLHGCSDFQMHTVVPK